MKKLAIMLGITREQIYKQYKAERKEGCTSLKAYQNIMMWLDMERIYNGVGISIWN